MKIYLESSALAAWLFEQEKGSLVLNSLNRADTVLSSVLTIVETKRAIARSKHLKEAQRQRLRGLLENTATQWTLMEISPEIRTRVGDAFPCEPVRTLDAIHLATALEFCKIFPELRVLSLDLRILENLESLGLKSVL